MSIEIAGTVKWYGAKVLKEMRAQEKIIGREMGKRMSKSAKSKCSVGTIIREGGKYWATRTPRSLRKSIRYKYLRVGNDSIVRIIAGSKKVFYARYVEKGTKFMRAKPFLRPALDEGIVYFRKVIAQRKLVK